jgi:hypothetical protein
LLEIDPLSEIVIGWIGIRHPRAEFQPNSALVLAVVLAVVFRSL